MTNQLTADRTRRNRMLAVVLAITASLGFAVTTAPAAWAAGAITVNGSTPGASIATFDGDTLIVDGGGFQAGKAVAIAVCNTTLDPSGASHCSVNSAASTTTDGSGNFAAQSVAVEGSFRDFNFQTGGFTSPLNYTVCSGYTGGAAGSPSSTGTCSLQIVQYGGSTPGGAPVQVITIPLTF